MLSKDLYNTYMFSKQADSGSDEDILNVSLNTTPALTTAGTIAGGRLGAIKGYNASFNDLTRGRNFAEVLDHKSTLGGSAKTFRDVMKGTAKAYIHGKDGIPHHDGTHGGGRAHLRNMGRAIGNLFRKKQKPLIDFDPVAYSKRLGKQQSDNLVPGASMGLVGGAVAGGVSSYLLSKLINSISVNAKKVSEA